MPLTRCSFPIRSRRRRRLVPLGQIGDAIAAGRRKQLIADTINGAIGPDGQLDFDRAGAALTRAGLFDEARPMLAPAQQKAAMGQTASHQAAQLGMERQKLAFEKEKPVILPYGSGVMRRTGEVIREPGGAETGAFDEATLDQLARQAIAGDSSVFTNLGRGAQGATNVIALRKRIAEINASAGETGSEQAARQAEYFGTKAGQRTLGTRIANIELAVTEAQKLAPLALSASDAVDRTRFPTLNAALLAVEKGTGDENTVRLGIATNSLINVYARAINPTGVPTVSDKEHARELLSAAWSKGQFAAGIDQLMKEMAAARQAPGEVRQEMRGAVTGKKEPSAPSVPAAAVTGKGIQISPEALAAYKANPALAIEHAQKAIKKGKDPAAARSLLQQLGIDPSKAGL